MRKNAVGYCPRCDAPLDEFGCRIVDELDADDIEAIQPDHPGVTSVTLSECRNPKYASH